MEARDPGLSQQILGILLAPPRSQVGRCCALTRLWALISYRQLRPWAWSTEWTSRCCPMVLYLHAVESKPIFTWESRGPWSWDLETLGFSGDSADEVRGLLALSWKEEAGSKSLDEEAQLAWYEGRLEALRSTATAVLRQTFDPRSDLAEDGYIDSDLPCEILGIDDHLRCENELNWDGTYTYVSVFEPATERARIGSERRRIRGPEAMDDPRLHSVVSHWDAELARLESFLQFLSESGTQIGVRLLTSLC